MSDKQIIIDDQNKIINILEQECTEKMDIIVALENKLKSKEQECEELKKQLIKCDDNIIVDCEYSKKDLCSFIHRKKEVINGLQQQLDQLKVENDELKNKIFRYEELLKHSAMAQNTYTAEEVNTIASGIKFVGNSLIAEENNKLHKTLTEIKEIMKKHCRKCKKHKFYHFQLCCTCKYTDILQKISECEVGND